MPSATWVTGEWRSWPSKPRLRWAVTERLGKATRSRGWTWRRQRQPWKVSARRGSRRQRQP